MGGSKSSSSSSQSQSTSTFADESLKEISANGGGVQAVEFSNNQGVDSPTVNVNNDGLQGAEVVRLFEAVSLGVDSIVGTISNQTSEAVSSITKIAESATGTTSETGSTINKLALPAMILAGLFLILKSGVFK